MRLPVFAALAAFVLLSTSDIQNAVASPFAAAECEALLVDKVTISQVFDRQFATALEKSKRFEKLYLRVKRAALRQRLFEKCKAAGGCTPAQIGEFVSELVAATIDHTDAKGYAFLAGVMAANAAAATGVTMMVNSDISFVPTFVTFFLGQSMVITANTVAPFAAPIGNRVQKVLYGIREAAKKKKALYESEQSHDAQADTLNATYNLREQQVTDRVMNFRNALKLNALAAAYAGSTGNIEIIVAELGDGAMAGFRHYREIDPADPTIVNVIGGSFLQKVTIDSQSLYEAALEYVRARDPNFNAVARRSGEPNARQYYERAFCAWLNYEKK